MGKVFNVMKDETNDRPLDIHDYLVKHPASTFFMKMEGDGPEGSGIEEGDVLVVDRSVTAKRGSIVVMTEDGELKVTKFPSSDDSAESSLWGVVIGLLRNF
ncbi:hypothetical protein A2837_01125 [Candidatus Kaiserbacteria bacterium RIFCSPHIGHO2_01_FULL_46_22]|uniref:Peptidase S24/S26A/S26B/S26C domain-containing protein n=1 Tax=Candidatus Kaiserbacteria bacterium RIFCSPHIGHO2_01_FULL_46_22 TaxID=1798475 RepID=A0A1F6BXW7_9BACT|nr:MAG: hypothetical protein A2837_01125 [Candidatus Kaiserbacteria bacterium RIFCSPHIGHO2_01_FULL_46_22]